VQIFQTPRQEKLEMTKGIKKKKNWKGMNLPGLLNHQGKAKNEKRISRKRRVWIFILNL